MMDDKGDAMDDLAWYVHLVLGLCCFVSLVLGLCCFFLSSFLLRVMVMVGEGRVMADEGRGNGGRR